MYTYQQLHRSKRRAGIMLAGLLLFLTSIYSTDVLAQQSALKVERISFESGLSHSIVTCILQDRQGFLWVGTMEGLNRYDGYTFTVYTHDPHNPQSISHNHILALYEDRSGVLWVGTKNGLNAFDRQHNRFTRYIADPANPERSVSQNVILSLAEDQVGGLWIGTGGGGLNRLNRDTGEVTVYRRDPADPHSLPDDWVNTLYTDRDGDLWIGTEQGLACRDSGSGELTLYRHDPGDPGSLSHDAVSALYEDRAGTLWVGTRWSGLNALNRATGQFTRYTNHPEDPRSLGNNSVLALGGDQRGTLWIGTVGGLHALARDTEHFTRYQYDPHNAASLSNDVIRALYADQSGILWIGTEGGGLNKINPDAQAFRTYSPESPDPYSLRVTSLYADQTRELWVGTAGGLYRIDRLTGEFTPYKHDPAATQRSSRDTICALHHATATTLWIGTCGDGLERFDRASGAFTPLAYPLSSLQIRAIAQDESGALWVGTDGGGLNRIDPISNAVTIYQADPDNPDSLSSNRIFTVYIDRNRRLWVGADDGLCQFERKSGHFLQYRADPQDPRSLHANAVYAIYEDRAGNVWVGADSGLHQWLPETGGFLWYQARNDLLGDKISGIAEDSTGHLWLSQDRGLVRFDPQTGNARRYDANDGASGYPFLAGACYQNQRGEIFLGGIQGAVAFQPERIRTNQHIPPVVVTDFQLFNTSVSVQPDSPLQQTITETSTLTLAYRENVFAFEFAALDYASPAKNQYKYILEGFDADWIAAKHRRFASYAHVPPGVYTFRVVGSNNDGLWNQTGAAIAIRLTPPPWKTWWAYTLYGLSLTGLIAGYVWSQQRKLRRERLLNERLRRLDQLKDEFLAKTSHEIRTPLQGIIGITESLLDGVAGEPSDIMRRNFTTIIAAGLRLASLLDDLLDLARLKQGQITLHRKPIDVRTLTDVVLTLNEPLAKGKALTLKNAIGSDLPLVDGDENRLQQVLHNLIGNAMKFTPAHGCITVSAERSDQNFLSIAVTDTGVGMSAETQASIFQSIARADQLPGPGEYGGLGLGLPITKQIVELHSGTIQVASEEGRGAAFTVTLPIAKGTVEAADVEDSPRLQVTRAATFHQDTLALVPAEPEYPATVSSERFEVLIVDDEPLNHQVLANHLATGNYAITQTFTGAEALQLFANGQKFDLVLLDVMMPKMSGYEVCREIRKIYLPGELPVIIITAKNQVSDLVVGLSSGANDYLAKPFSKDELLARIHTHLNLAKINAAYGRFVPREFLRFLGRDTIIDVKLGDYVQREVTIFFSDIRSFTALSETMSPRENFNFLNSYLKRMGPVIRAHQGFVDKFIGDGIMAIFPGQPNQAIDAAIATLRELAVYNAHRLRSGYAPIEIGIGLHTGHVMLGTIGEAERMEGTVIADAVNLAARIEGLTKRYGASLLISEHVLDRMSESHAYNYRFLGRMQVKGKDQAVAVYELYDGDPEPVRAAKMQTKTDFETGLQHYFDKEFLEAAGCFKHVLQVNPADKPARLYLERAAHFMVHDVPDDWQGVESIESK